jgi:hypothetical protein
MPRRSNAGHLTGEVERFKASVRQAALLMVDSVIRQELQRRLDSLRQSLKTEAAPVRLARLARPNARDESQPATTPTKAEIRARDLGGKRSWTREAIVSELATWLASGTTIDAAFVTRHGPPGLVTATRKVFGRFDAALNVASLQVAKLYPDGRPSRRTV